MSRHHMATSKWLSSQLITIFDLK
uniref:Uncharacterized protein n=1 Tax=Anguilla anguilla TaxID=7936 RepID=A0A0E9RHF1_ANGAN